MKAKDMASGYADAKDKSTYLASTARAMLLEVHELADKRQAKTDSAMAAILNEQDAKWKAFARRADKKVSPTGFEAVVRGLMPDLYPLWMRERADQERRRKMR